MSPAVTAAIIGALGTSMAVVVSYLLTRRATKQIHILVNSQLQHALSKINRLEDTLRSAGIAVPRNGREG